MAEAAVSWLVLAVENALLPFGGILAILLFAASRRRRVLLGLGDELRERLGGGPAAEPPVVWLHAASAGEVSAASPLISRLAARAAQPKVLVTTLTATGRERARAVPGVAVARLAPLDGWPFLQRFAARARPRALVVVETELWPAMLALMSRRAAPAFVVNGRVSDRSFPRYRLAKPLLAPFLRRLTLICAQSERDAERFRALGARPERVVVTGNLKYDAASPSAPARQAEEALSRLEWRDKALFVAGSTHPGEEPSVCQAFAEARREFPEARLVIAPRHVERAAETAATLRAAGLRPLLWSQLQDCASGDALVLDRLGLLAAFYPFSRLAFVGGTLVPVGGHSLLEPALAGALLCFGPHVENTLEPAQLLESAGGARCVEDAAGLVQVLRDALRDPARAKAQGELSRKTAESLRGAADRTMTALDPMLSKAGL